MTFQKIAISTTKSASVERAWQAFTTPADITRWNFASDDWCCEGLPTPADTQGNRI